MEGHRGTEEEEASSKRVSCGLERACEEWESGELPGIIGACVDLTTTSLMPTAMTKIARCSPAMRASYVTPEQRAQHGQWDRRGLRARTAGR